jgi:hypothetical protein
LACLRVMCGGKGGTHFRVGLELDNDRPVSRQRRFPSRCDLVGQNLRFNEISGRVSPVAPRPREGPLTEPIAGVQPWPRERVLMPLTRHSLGTRFARGEL